MTNDSKFTVVEHDFRKKSNEDKEETKKALESVLEYLKEGVDSEEDPSRAIIAITFSTDDQPAIVLGGKIDPLATMGFLRILEMDLLHRYAVGEVSEDEWY